VFTLSWRTTSLRVGGPAAIVVLNSTQLNEHVRTQVLTPQCPHLFNTTTYETTHLLLHVLIYLQTYSYSCLPGLRRGGGGRLAGAAVLSCLVWRCELTAGVRPEVALRRPTHFDADRTSRAVGPTQFTPPHQTRQNSPVCVVSGVTVTISFKITVIMKNCKRQGKASASARFRDVQMGSGQGCRIGF